MASAFDTVALCGGIQRATARNYRHTRYSTHFGQTHEVYLCVDEVDARTSMLMYMLGLDEITVVCELTHYSKAVPYRGYPSLDPPEPEEIEYDAEIEHPAFCGCEAPDVTHLEDDIFESFRNEILNR